MNRCTGRVVAVLGYPQDRMLIVSCLYTVYLFPCLCTETGLNEDDSVRTGDSKETGTQVRRYPVGEPFDLFL